MTSNPRAGRGCVWPRRPPENESEERKMTSRLALFQVCFLMVTRPAAAADWHQWRGPHQTGASDKTGLLRKWPAEEPPLLWTCADAGLGLSGPAVVGDRLYTLSAHDEVEYVFALDVRSGRELWRTAVGPIYTFPGNTFGDGPRSTPTVDGDLLYALSGLGELICVEAAGGQVPWRTNLVRDLGGEFPETDGSPPTVGWGYA